MVLNLVTTMFIGMLCGMLWQSIVFYLSYIPLRSYAGGYHAKTPVRCYLFSIAMMLIILSVMKLAHISNLIYGIMMMCSLVCIYCLAPVEDVNKPLDKKERKVYRHRARIIALSELIVALLCFSLHQEDITKCIVWSMITLCVILIMGWVKNSFRLYANRKDDF